MKKCPRTSLSNAFLPLSIALLAVISLPILFAGCGSGAGHESSSFQNQLGVNGPLSRQAQQIYGSEPSIISDPVYDPATNTVSIHITILRDQFSKSGKGTTRASIRDATTPSSTAYTLWQAFLDAVHTLPSCEPFRPGLNREPIKDYYTAISNTGGFVYSTDYGLGSHWKLAGLTNVGTQEINLKAFRPGWDEQNQLPTTTLEKYSDMTMVETVSLQGTDLIATTIDKATGKVLYSGNAPTTYDIFVKHLIAAAQDNAAQRYGTWKHTSSTGNGTQERTYELRKLTIKSLSFEKEDAQGNTTPITDITIPKNGEKLRIKPVFQGYGNESWTPAGVRWEINILDSNGATVLKQESSNPSYFSWNGADTNGTPVPAGQYTFSLFAFVPEATWAEYVHNQSQPTLSIENTKAKPDDFPIPDTTTISADIVTKDFTPTSLKWKVVITQGDTEIKSFPESDGDKVSVVWDGKNDSGNYCEFGDYTYTITATCDETQAEVQGTVSFSPPLVTVTKLKFQDSFRIVQDDGTAINRTYYKVAGGEIKKNPIALPLSKLTAATGLSQSRDAHPISQGKFDLDMELYNNDTPVSSLPNGIGLKIEMHSSKDVLVKEAYATFEQRKVRIKDGVFEIPRKVQVIDAIRIKSTWVKKLDGEWVPIGKPRDDVRLNLSPEANIWITLDNPVEPIGEAQKDRVREGLLDIACYLAEGAQTPEEAKKMMVERLHEWLRQKGFNYWNGGATFLDINPGDNCEFDYTEFIKPLYGPPESIPSPTPTPSSHALPPPLDPEGFYGQCHDVAAFYVLCCAALGMDMKMTRIAIPMPQPYRFWTNSATTCGKKELWRGLFDYDPREESAYRIATLGRWAFRYHQVVIPPGNLDSIFDPTLKYNAGNGLENGFSVGAPKSIYKENVFYASGKYAPADEIVQDPEWRQGILTLKDVKWPDKKVWWPQKKAEYHVEEE